MAKNSVTELDIRITAGPNDMQGEVFTVDLVENVPDGSLTDSQLEGFATTGEFLLALAESGDEGALAAAVMAVPLSVAYGVVRLVNRVRSANNTVILVASVNPDVRVYIDEVEKKSGEWAPGLSKSEIERTSLRVRDDYAEGLILSTYGRTKEGELRGRLKIKGMEDERFVFKFHNPLGSNQGRSEYKLLRSPGFATLPGVAPLTQRGEVELQENHKGKDRQDVVVVLFS